MVLKIPPHSVGTGETLPQGQSVPEQIVIFHTAMHTLTHTHTHTNENRCTRRRP